MSICGNVVQRIGLHAGLLALPSLPSPVVRLLSVCAFRYSDPRLYTEIKLAACGMTRPSEKKEGLVRVRVWARVRVRTGARARARAKARAKTKGSARLRARLRLRMRSLTPASSACRSA